MGGLAEARNCISEDVELSLNVGSSTPEIIHSRRPKQLTKGKHNDRVCGWTFVNNVHSCCIIRMVRCCKNRG